MYKKCHGKLPKYHSDQLQTNTERGMNTRREHDVYIVRTDKRLTKINSINYKVGTHWNELPKITKASVPKTLSTFTNTIKKLYLSKYSDTCNKVDCYPCKAKHANGS